MSEAPAGARVLARTRHLRELVDRARQRGVALDGVWVVGGAVRDALLDRDVLDIDLAVVGDGPAFADVLANAVGGAVVARHGFGTAAVVLPTGPGSPDVRIDVATARTETYPHPGALPEVRAAASIDDDLRRRDFSINAIAMPLSGGEHAGLTDPYGGVRDLRAGRVRVLHDGSFVDDPTRMFRAVRYAGRYGFAIEHDTAAQLEDALAGRALGTVSAARVRSELELLLEEPAQRALELLFDTGIAARLHPGLVAGRGRAVQLVGRLDGEAGDDPTAHARRWRRRLAALAEPLGEEGAGAWARELTVRARDVAAIVNHVGALQLVRAEGPALAMRSLAELRATLRRYTTESLLLAALATDDAQAAAAIRRYADSVGRVQLSVTGHELLELGIPRGPAVGEVLEELYDLKLEGRLPTPADEHAAAVRLVAQRLHVDGGPA